MLTYFKVDVNVRAQSSKFKTGVLAVHLCGVVACCAAIVVQIAVS